MQVPGGVEILYAYRKRGVFLARGQSAAGLPLIFLKEDYYV